MRKERILLSWKDTLWYISSLSKWRWKRPSWAKRNKNYKIYKEGLKAFNSELDCVAIINSIRKLDTYLKSMTEVKALEKLNTL